MSKKSAKSSLKKYRAKRSFKATPEPKPKTKKSKDGELKFVIQKHAARRLHYDFRLEVDGVLKSWAIPKGPSLDPLVKRLAIQVEDHPYDYRNFEGIIPKGYGAGTVQIWDHGTYQVEGEKGKNAEKIVRDGLKKGSLHFSLKGKKLKGEFVLVKLKSKQDEWLLIKAKDAFSSKEPVINKDRSVVSNQTIEEISDKPLAQKKGKKKSRPKYLKPMLATLVDEPFDHPEWLFEIKLDGFRAIADLNPKKTTLYSRSLQIFNDRFPNVVLSLENLGLNAILDGEIVALDRRGISHFQMLQNVSSESNVFYYVFDILYLDGRDVRDLPLIDRKKILKGILKKDSRILYLDHVEERGKKFFQLCKKNGLEGIIGKNKQSKYLPGERSKEWVKIKAELRQEVVICGVTEPKKSRKNFGALIVGIYRNGILSFAGHVGGGFTEKQLKEIRALLEPLFTKKCPFKNPPQTNTAVTWVKPKYLCEVKFKEWTDSGIMRMPIFVGIRADKPPNTIVQEKPKSIEKYRFVTHQEKLYWEKEKISKQDLLDYYASISKFILPYLKDRPETLKRYPEGIAKPNFYQKNVKNIPEWLETVQIQHTGKRVNYMVIQDEQSLLYAANLGCIEMHPWFSRIQSLEYPDFLMFDLDPEAISFDAVVETAQAIHALLESVKVPSYCKTSGGRGLHIAVPLNARYSYEQAKTFAELIAVLVHQNLPKITSLERRPSKRQKKVYIDCYQNNYGQTLAAPYSVRAKPGAPVSTPLEWKEVKRGLNPADYHLFNTLARLKKKGDLFRPVLGKGIDLKTTLKCLQSLAQ